LKYSSYLNLGKEFQGLSYDMMTAHTAVVFSRYIMLAVENRNGRDNRTLGELFYLYFDELQDIQFNEALALILELLAVMLQEFFMLDKKQVNEFLDMFISKLPRHIQNRLPKPESA